MPPAAIHIMLYLLLVIIVDFSAVTFAFPYDIAEVAPVCCFDSYKYTKSFILNIYLFHTFLPYLWSQCPQVLLKRKKDRYLTVMASYLPYRCDFVYIAHALYFMLLINKYIFLVFAILANLVCIYSYSSSKIIFWSIIYSHAQITNYFCYFIY